MCVRLQAGLSNIGVRFDTRARFVARTGVDYGDAEGYRRRLMPLRHELHHKRSDGER